MEISALVRNFIEALNQHDTSRVAELVAEDVIYDSRFGPRVIGVEQMQYALGMDNRYFGERYENVVVMTASDSLHASAELTISGIYQRSHEALPAASGQSYTIPAGLFFEVDDGRISRFTVYVNMSNWQAALEKTTG